MYKIDKTQNRILAVDQKTFSDLGFSERNHLQEWLEHCPGVFGEELLFIQKEFDGFNDTRERLDLLALDKNGNLVIIENKLDDSGRDVVWQALKYAGYCANLTKKQVVAIFQDYLNQISDLKEEERDAEKILSDFLEVDDLNEAIINRGQSQRLIFVAANFRKEVTNTVLWLIGNQIQCQCFKVTPYQAGAELFLNVEQIIPTPESEEFMINMAAKEAEEKTSGKELKVRHTRRLEFWGRALSCFKNSNCRLFDNISPSKDHWLSAGSGISSMPFSLVFGKSFIRVEFVMSRYESEINTFTFNQLEEHKNEIEKEFGMQLEWWPLPQKKSCYIIYERKVDGYDKKNWPEIIEWLIEHMVKLHKAISPYLPDLNKKIKKQFSNKDTQ
jgi:hypothetical protein